MALFSCVRIAHTPESIQNVSIHENVLKSAKYLLLFLPIKRLIQKIDFFADTQAKLCCARAVRIM